MKNHFPIKGRALNFVLIQRAGGGLENGLLAGLSLKKQSTKNASFDIIISYTRCKK